MRNPQSIRDLLAVGGDRLGALQARAQARSVALAHVRAALPEKLAAHIVSAGIEGGRLTVSVAGATWATRLRYVTDSLKLRVGLSLNADIQSVRIKVGRPRA